MKYDGVAGPHGNGKHLEAIENVRQIGDCERLRTVLIRVKRVGSLDWIDTLFVRAWSNKQTAVDVVHVNHRNPKRHAVLAAEVVKIVLVPGIQIAILSGMISPDIGSRHMDS